MPDGKALQSGTSHDLGQNFSRAFHIQFTDADGAIKFAYTTSWGVSWRMLGAMIMAHGDDRGLRIPPKLAPIEAVFIPIVRGEDRRAVERAHELAAGLKRNGMRVRVDDREQSPGWKYAEWEMRGVPLRIEIGPRDVDAGSVIVVRRDLEKGAPDRSRSVAIDALETELRRSLELVQESLYRQAKEALDTHIVRIDEREAFYEAARARVGMIDIAWCDRVECEAHIKAECSATTRVLRPLEGGETTCVACGEPAKVRAYVAASY
ncbi:MAG TPA: His/Gly/Thr/Pro-type tRNA ligase C-terminal domain-containing protein, partial [Candidatus Dormibacteraeota bacterium]|nr:His/Gly/Thr/Pro-type tRNA ligase C-terminal domain-containing protein [Candidatus Dormibacteraeota bacterium]